MGRIKTYNKPPVDPMAKHIGDVLLELRTKYHKTLRVVAAESGLSTSYVCEVENAKTMPTVKSVWKLAKCFGVPFAYFLKNYRESDGDLH